VEQRLPGKRGAAFVRAPGPTRMWTATPDHQYGESDHELARTEPLDSPGRAPAAVSQRADIGLRLPST